MKKIINRKGKGALFLISMAIIITLFSMNLVFSFEFDNIKSYNPILKEVTITNAFGLGDTITKAKLITPTKNIVTEGNDIKVAEFDIDNYDDYNSLIGDFKFIDLKNNKPILRTLDVKYKDYEDVIVNDYKLTCKGTGEINKTDNKEMQNCSRIKNGSHIESRRIWKDINTKTIFPKGNKTIGLFTDVKSGDYVEWIPTLAGVKVTEWATWEAYSSMLNIGLVSYWTMNETSGNVVDSLGVHNGSQSSSVTSAGKINQSRLYGGESSGDYDTIGVISYSTYSAATINAWVYLNNAVQDGGVLGQDNNDYQLSLSYTGGGYFRLVSSTDGSYPGWATDTDHTITGDHWYMLTAVWNGTNTFMYLNGTLQADLDAFAGPPNAGGSSYIGRYVAAANSINGLIDEVSVWNRTLNSTEIAILYNDGDGITYSYSGNATYLESPSDNYTSNSGSVTFNCSAVASGAIVNMSLYHNYTSWDLNQTKSLTGTSNSTTFISSFPDGNYEWSCRVCYNDGTCLFANENRTLTVETSFPAISIVSGNGTYDIGYLSVNHTVSYNVTGTNLDRCWIQYPIPQLCIFANVGDCNTHYIPCTSGKINTTNFQLQLTTYKPFTAMISANNSIGNIDSSEFNWTYKLFILNETYVASTISGTINNFLLETLTDGLQATIGYLNYNNTNVLGSINSFGNYYNLTRNQIATGVSNPTNISFYWNITLSDGTNLITETKNQTTIPVVINETCGVGMYPIFNFTLLDEINQGTLNGTIENSSIKVNLNLYTSDRTLKLNQFYKEFSKTNPISICMDNNLSGGKQFSVDIQVQYGATNYSSEFYNIEMYQLNSSSLSETINLYDLDNTHTQKFRLIARDTSYLPIENALIRIERKYIENGTFYAIEIPKTDDNGVTSASLQLNDVIYNFYIYQNGILVSSFTNVLAICQTPLVTTCEIDFNSFQTGITIPNYEEGEDFNFTLNYNSTSKIVTSQFAIPSGIPGTVLLQVTKEDSLGTAVCSDTLVSTSGILSCAIPNTFGNATVMAKIYKNNVEQGKGSIKLDQNSSDIFGVILVILSVIVLITLVGIGVSDNPVVTGIFLFVGVVLIFAINLVQNTGFIGATATILFIAIAIILVIIKAARRS